jgi:uncharacterized protein YneR
MNTEEIKKYEFGRKMREYEMKITKMAGHLSDYYIDRAIESEDFSTISSYLIEYFSSGSVGKSFDVGYLVSKYKEFGLNDKIEDIDFNINEWYKIKYDFDNNYVGSHMNEHVITMNDEDYIKYMIEKRKKDISE